MDYKLIELRNGIRFLYIPNESPVSYCSINFGAGSRDEAEKETGLAHFIEHVYFKGTERKNARKVVCCLDEAGGDLNAFTTKEETVIHATFLKDDYQLALDLLSDIAFHSVFPENELEKEKEIIIDEINSYKDSPSELIFDEFEELVFKNHPLGKNILGTPSGVKRFKRQMVLDFIRRNYASSSTIICFLGTLPNSGKQLENIAKKYFENIPENKVELSRIKFDDYSPEIKSISRKSHQAHCILGSIAYNFFNPKRLTLHLLNNLLGGPGMNSRLNMSLREKHACAYSIESMYSPYSDTGLFQIYLGTQKELLEKSIELIFKELNLLCSTKLSTIQLNKAKRQIKAQLAIGNENKESLMLGAAKSFLYFNTIESLDSICKKIDNISADDLLTVANEIFSTKNLTILQYR